jgi:transposase
MRKQLYWLRHEEWQKLEPLLPRGRRGAHRVDDRRVISGIIYMLRSGARWRDCPTGYGPPTRRSITASTAGALEVSAHRGPSYTRSLQCTRSEELLENAARRHHIADVPFRASNA